jgi:peptidase C1-like protein
MKTLAIIFAIVAIASAVTTPISVEAYARTQKIIEEVNSASTTWTAAHNKFSGRSEEDIKKVCND